MKLLGLKLSRRRGTHWCRKQWWAGTHSTQGVPGVMRNVEEPVCVEQLNADRATQDKQVTHEAGGAEALDKMKQLSSKATLADRPDSVFDLNLDVCLIRVLFSKQTCCDECLITVLMYLKRFKTNLKRQPI